MNIGKTLFAQIHGVRPLDKLRARIMQRYGGNAGVRRLTCAEQFRAMAFAQMTWRESLSDIEVSLSANVNKRYVMGCDFQASTWMRKVVRITKLRPRTMILGGAAFA